MNKFTINLKFILKAISIVFGLKVSNLNYFMLYTSGRLQRIMDIVYGYQKKCHRYHQGAQKKL